MRFDVAVSGALILSAANGYAPFYGSMGVKDSRIAWVTEKTIAPSECDTWVDGTDRILMPGLVNAHCHGDMTLARGLGDDLTLLEQNQRFADTSWFYTLITDDDRYAARQLTYCEALLAGTTFQMENMYWGLGARSSDAMAEIGIRGALAEDIRRDFSQPDLFLPDSELLALQESCRAAGQQLILGGISEEDFEPRRVRAVSETARRLGLRTTCHLAENTWRLERVRREFGTGSVDFLHRNGALNDQLIASHVIYLDSREIRQLRDSGTSVANTPLCEMKIADGIAPIPEMVRIGVNVCLGTDGPMWNNSSDLFREMKGMSLLHTIHSGIRSLKTTDILDMATINGARAFGLEDEMGTVQEGKSADLILVRTDRPHMQPLRTGLCENVSSSIVFCATGNDVSDVFVKGRCVVRGGTLLTANVKDIIWKVQEATEKIARKIENI